MSWRATTAALTLAAALALAAAAGCAERGGKPAPGPKAGRPAFMFFTRDG